MTLQLSQQTWTKMSSSMDDDQKYESGVPDVRGISIGDGGVQHEGSVEDGSTAVRPHLEPKHKVFLSHSGAQKDFVEQAFNLCRPHLEPKHKVFLSHSGAQKDFVEQLCIDLERSDRYPFFDKRRSSLPVGMMFPKLLFAAIQQCDVGVVVLSEDFFTKTKWPMLELVEMMKVSKKLETSINIVPVFFRTSREECRKRETQERWISKWEGWAKIDKTINIDEWKAALKIFGSTTSLPLKDGEVQLRKEVVDAVCELVPPERRWDDSNVEGKDRLCKVVLEKLKFEPEGPRVGVCVIGLYGMGGIGKSTICKVLCNKLHKDFRGKVCYTEMKSASETELFRAVLKTLTETRHDLLDEMDLDQCRDQLKICIVRQPVFLAIDNVDEESAQQAKIYLEGRHSFGNGSVVVVTARSLDQLKALNIHEDNCLEMPELELLEAKTLFENHAASMCDVKYKLDERTVTGCVEMCCFRKGDGVTHHYHPLALKVLGKELREQLGCNNFDSSLWDAKLSKIEKSHELLETRKQIFSILRISYDTLSHEDQMLFMDVALFVEPGQNHYSKSFGFRDWLNMIEWLCLVHGERDHDVLKRRLEKFKKKSLLEKVGDRTTNVGMHDLWREFCVAETKVGKFADRRWVYFGVECNELGESSPSGRCWENLERMCFTTEAGLQKFLGLRLDHFLNVKVLQVVQPMMVMDPMVVDLGKLIHLKHLELVNYWDDLRMWGSNHNHVERIKVHGLGLLARLASLQWVSMPDEVGYAEDIGCLTDLQFLSLPYCRGSRLPDMSKLTSLRVAFFKYSRKVETIIGLSSKLSKFRCLNLASCSKLQSCPGVGDLIGLESLDLAWCERLEELPDLGKLSNLKELKMIGCSSLGVCPGLCGLRCLRKMDISHCGKLTALPSLSDLVSLEEFRAEWCGTLAEFPDVRNLTKLRALNIYGCPLKTIAGFEGLIALRDLRASFELLQDWPDLHSFTSLRHVKLKGWSGPGWTSIAKHAMLETLEVYECKEVALQLDLWGMRSLQTLNFVFCESKDVSVINASELRNLSVWHCINLESLDLSNFLQLEKLEVNSCPNLWRGLTIREPFVALRSIEVTHCGNLGKVPDLSYFPNLQELDLYRIPWLTSLTSDIPLPALKWLSVYKCKRLIAVPDLSCFPHLKTLYLEFCESLTGLNSGVPLVALDMLSLGECRNLKTLPDLSKFPSLRVLDVRMCVSLLSLTSSEPLPALEELNLEECRILKALPDLSNFPSLTDLNLRLCVSLLSLTSSMPLPALETLHLKGCRSLKALPDHLCSSVKLRDLRIKGIGIVLSDDYVNELLASCVDLDSVNTWS